ncbi:MAG: helix-turn-helix transcriptional regulator [Chloroflexi bacterium]|nr:helix-turn-helix transcriptional regulator [Chloroflexota bacterium]
MGKSSQPSDNGTFPVATREPDARKTYNLPCTIARALDVLGDRWTLLILRDLMAGLHRYTEIQESCAGMSPNVLSDRLKRLQAEGLIERHHQKGLPPQVDYTLTEKGWAVRPVLQSLIAWGNQFAGSLNLATVGTAVSTDFAVRVVPTFAFKPERAATVKASMVVEITDCAECNTWTFEVKEGHIYPRRHAVTEADVRLKTDTQGFFAFIHGTVSAEDCGEVLGDLATAAAIQSCFLSA